MPPRLNLFSARSTLAYRFRPRFARPDTATVPISQIPRRTITADEKPLPTTDNPKGPNQDQLPHVSEEASQLSKITGEAGPELEQGTPVQEMLERDAEGQKNAPQVVKDKIDSDAAKGKRSFSTSAHRRQEAGLSEVSRPPPTLPPGLKFELPAELKEKATNFRYRYDDVVDLVTKMLMKHGKLSVAQRNVTFILNHLRTAPAPLPDPKRPLLTGDAPAAQLPLDPIQYLTVAIDSVAPLLRLRSQRGAAGGGVALMIPIPLMVRQRRRTAVKWILDAASKRQSGGGKMAGAKNFADEIVAVMEGRSSVWRKRDQVHAQAVTARANVRWGGNRKR